MQRNHTLRTADRKRHIIWDITLCSPLKVASIFSVEEKAKQETSMKQIASIPEDGGNMFLRKVGCLSTDYTALYPTR
jgi:hypothetical protein